jgi:hypothetical protein
MPEAPTEPNEFNDAIDATFVEHDPHIIAGDVSDADKQQTTELTGAAILTAAEQRGSGTIDDTAAHTESVGSPSIETTTSVTPNALASQTIKPTLEAEKDESAGSFATSEQQASAELESATDRGQFFDPTTKSL